ncbi:MAG: hypothetical protein ABI217_06085 [Chthoniobacterales bacterium]
MPVPHKIFASVAAVICLTASAAFPAGKPRSTSTSRQFIVYGADARVRGAMCDLAEQTKANLLRLLELRDNWKTALIINLEYPQANVPDTPAAQLDFSQLGYGLKLQLNLLVTDEMRGEEVQRQLLRVILIEMMYRGRSDIAAGTPYVTPPDWLVDGVLALQPGRDSDDNAKLLQTMVSAQKITPLEDLVRQRRGQLDAPSRQLHDAYAMAFLQLLRDAPGGPRKLAQFIADLPAAPNDVLADLRAHFPETLGRSPAKWWTLSVARLSASDRHETLSAAETATRLDRLLRFSIPAPDGSTQDHSLGDYEVFRKLPAHRAVLARVGQQLLLLSALAHPSYRAIVQEHFELAQLIARGKPGKIQPRLARVASYRQVVERQKNEIDDYLNWYEATQVKKVSGAFRQLLETAKAADEAQPRRRDPISVYLDSIEMEMN